MRFGERMAARRNAAGLSQRELSRRTGVPQQYISLLEIGKNDNVSGAYALRLARALGTTADYLLGGDDGVTDQAQPPKEDEAPERDSSELGERITALLMIAGLSQSELARRSGVPQTYISLLARGVNDNPGAETVVKLAAALHTTTDYLLTGQRTPVDTSAWDGIDRRSMLRETYRALAAHEADFDAQTLRGLDKQFASFVEGWAHDLRRLRKMAERSAGAVPVGASANLADGDVKKV